MRPFNYEIFNFGIGFNWEILGVSTDPPVEYHPT